MASFTVGGKELVSATTSLEASVGTANTNISNLQACLGSASTTMGSVGQGGQTHYNMGANKTMTQLLQELETQVNTARTEAANGAGNETAAAQHVKRQTALSSLISGAMTRVAQTRATYADDTSGTGSASLIGINYQGGLDLWLTNSHTVRKDSANATSLTILRPTSEVVPSNIVAWDDDYDVAFFTTPHQPGLQPLELMAQTWREQPAQGTEVYMLGSPYTDKFTVTTGIVSDSGSIPDYFSSTPRTHTILDCVSRPGNSGGPVIDNTGKIVSIARYGATYNDELLETVAWTVPSWAIKDMLRRVTLSGVTGNLTPVWIPEVEFSSVTVPPSGLWFGLQVVSETTSNTESIGRRLTDLNHTNSLLLKSIQIGGNTYTLGYLDGQLSVHDFSYYGSNTAATLNYRYFDGVIQYIDTSIVLNINTN